MEETTRARTRRSSKRPSDIELRLNERHASYLANRGIADEVIRQRGYFSIDSSRDLPTLLKGSWPKDLMTCLDGPDNAALVVPLFGSDGAAPTTFQLRLDVPRETLTDAGNLKPIKFEIPSGIARGTEPGDLPSDILPSVAEMLQHEDALLVITEGACKADALTSAALRFNRPLAAVALTGVTLGFHRPESAENFSRDYVLTPSLAALPLQGREVVLAWDADAATKPAIASSLVRTADLLTAAGASVSILAVPAINGNAKTGIDDVLVSVTSAEEFDALLSTAGDLDAFRLVARSYADSDAGRGQRLADELVRRGDFRFVEKTTAKRMGEGSWLRFDGAKLTAEGAVSTINRIALELTARDSSTTHQTSRALENAVRHATVEPKLITHMPQLDAQPHLLGTATGQLIDLRNGTFVVTTAADGITKTTATGADFAAETPRFDKFLHEITLGDVELQTFLQVMAGMILLGDVTEEKLFLLYGTGKNGKSTFMKILQAVLGDDLSVTLRGDKLGAAMEDSTIAALRGARLALGDDALGDNLQAATIKRLSSGDRLTGRFLYESAVTFAPSHTTVLFANQLPKIDIASNAIWRRVVIVPFDLRIDDASTPTSGGSTIKRDAELDRRIVETEAEGVLAWAVRGAVQFIANGRELPVCERVLDASRRYQQEEDVVGSWLRECCVTGADEQENGRTLLASLQQFTEREYGFVSGKSQGAFKKELASRIQLTDGHSRDGRSRVWKGVSLTANAAEELARFESQRAAA